MSLLSAKEARFVAEYLVDGNGTRVAVAAGYGWSAGRAPRAEKATGISIAALAEIAAAESIASAIDPK